MTWHAPAGDLILLGEEASLFRDAIFLLCEGISEAIDDEDSICGGASLFNQMTRTQQLASLESVSEFLFHETAGCPELNAWNEATLATILAAIRTLLHIEIVEGDKDEIRNIIANLTACDVGQDDWSEWDSILDGYEDRFLWDNDFEVSEITDLPPDRADLVRQVMGIADEYYASVPPDLDDDYEIAFALKRIGMCIDGSAESE